jgi:hypothetical protein
MSLFRRPNDGNPQELSYAPLLDDVGFVGEFKETRTRLQPPLAQGFGTARAGSGRHGALCDNAAMRRPPPRLGSGAPASWPGAFR